MDGQRAEKDGETGRAWSPCGHPRRRSRCGGNMPWRAGQDKRPIKQIKNNSRNYRPHWTGASPWNEKNRMIRAHSQHGASGWIPYFHEVINAERDHVAETQLLPRRFQCCPLLVFPFSGKHACLKRHTTRLHCHKGVFSRSRRNAVWNVEMTHAVCTAAEQKHFANFGANTPYPFPFIVPFATD